MRQAADILASPAAMQIRQLEALQAMAKSGSSKVIFVPMQLQSDVIGAGQNSQGGVWNQQGGSGQGQITQSSVSEMPTGARGAGILSSMADI